MKANVYKLSLVKEKSVDYRYHDLRLHSPDTVAKLIRDTFHTEELAEEYVWAIAVDAKMHILGIFEVTHGGIDFSYVSVRDIFKRVLVCGGLAVFLVHNHPSGCVTPSNDDCALTKRVAEAGNLLDVKLIDHIIVGGDTYYSFNEEKQLI